MATNPNQLDRKSTAPTYPSPSEIERARWATGLTQTQAADVVYVTRRAWQLWEAGDRRMNLAFFELFQIKTKKP